MLATPLSSPLCHSPSHSYFVSDPTVGIGWIWLSLQVITDPFTLLQIPNSLHLSPFPINVHLFDIPTDGQPQHNKQTKLLTSSPRWDSLSQKWESLSQPLDFLLPSTSPVASPGASPVKRQFKCLVSSLDCHLVSGLRFVDSLKSQSYLSGLDCQSFSPTSSVPLLSELRKLPTREKQRNFRTRSHVLSSFVSVKGNCVFFR